jgi:hypothetical protein
VGGGWRRLQKIAPAEPVPLTPTKTPSGGVSKRLPGQFEGNLLAKNQLGNLQQCMGYRHDRALGSPPYFGNYS